MTRLVLKDLTPKSLMPSVNAPSSRLVWGFTKMDNNGMNYNGVGVEWNIDSGMGAS
jgi:hypothetical protein